MDSHVTFDFSYFPLLFGFERTFVFFFFFFFFSAYFRVEHEPRNCPRLFCSASHKLFDLII